MLAYYLGHKRIDFVKDGKQIVGTKLHFCVPADSTGVETGYITDTCFLSDVFIQQYPIHFFMPGDKISVTYNRYGKVMELTPYEAQS